MAQGESQYYAAALGLPRWHHLIPARWMVVGAATISMGAAYGVASTIGVLMAPFEAELGLLRGNISMAYALLAIGTAFGSLVAGRMVDRFPAGPIAATGIAVIGSGVALLSWQSSLETILIIYLVMGLFGFSCLFSPLMSTVSLWFDKGRGLAVGIVAAGGALGQAVVAPLLQAFVLGHGWRTACLLLAAIYLLLLLPVAALVRKPPLPEAAGSGGPAGVATAAPRVSIHVSVGLIALAGMFCCMVMGVPSVHLLSFALDRGLPAEIAAGLVTAVMLSAVAGRLLTGLVIDRLGALPSYATTSVLQTAGVYAFLPFESYAALYVVALVYGFGFGGVMTALVCAVREAVPARFVGTAMAVVGLLAWLGMAAGGYQGGLCFDLTGNYTASFTGAALAGLGNIGSIGLLGFLGRRERGAARTAAG